MGDIMKRKVSPAHKLREGRALTYSTGNRFHHQEIDFIAVLEVYLSFLMMTAGKRKLLSS